MCDPLPTVVAVNVHPDQLSEVLINNKQLLDEVFVICGIIKVEVSVISRDVGEPDNT